MLSLVKAVFSLMLGFIMAIVLGALLIPFLKRRKTTQNVSKHLNERHLKKQGTPTMGGFIFIASTLIILGLLLLNKNIRLSYNFALILFVFIAYGILGFLDDYLKIKFKNNRGLSILFKFFMQMLIALIFFAVFMHSGSNTLIDLVFFSLDLKYLYGIFILLMLVGFSNAVNITDGLDGLCAGLCAISFLAYGIIAFNSNYIIGYEEIGVFAFVLSGSLIGFLFYNFYPAKIFMGDLGSLALGAALAAIAIVLKSELSLFLIGIVYIIETLSSLLQIVAIRVFKKKIFKKSPIHHHLEELNFCESDILKIFYTFSLMVSLIALLLYVWN